MLARVWWDRRDRWVFDTSKVLLRNACPSLPSWRDSDTSNLPLARWSSKSGAQLPRLAGRGSTVSSMPIATVDGLSVAYDLVGEGRPWVITPGGRFDHRIARCRGVGPFSRRGGQSGAHLGSAQHRRVRCVFRGSVRISDASRRSCRAPGRARHESCSDHRGMGGARVSLLTASRHRQVAAALATWWVSGGVYGLMILATHYCGGSMAAAWRGGMQAVTELPEWSEVLAMNPTNHQRFLDQDPKQFVSTMERWMQAYCPQRR